MGINPPSLKMVLNFTHRLKPFGMNVAEPSGDQQLNAQQIRFKSLNYSGCRGPIFYAKKARAFNS
jgi:hypothetical protein